MSGILIADDDRILVDALKDYLEKMGYTIHIAYNGIEALRVFQSTQPEMVLLDIRMPGLNGFEVCRQIRMISTVPVYILSGLDHEIARIVGFEAGADEYIAKPFVFSDLSHRIQTTTRRIVLTSESDCTGISPIDTHAEITPPRVVEKD